MTGLYIQPQGRAQPRPHSHREGEGRWMKVTAMMEPRLNAKVLAQGRIQRSIEPGHASRSARSRIFAAEKKIQKTHFMTLKTWMCSEQWMSRIQVGEEFCRS